MRMYLYIHLCMQIVYLSITCLICDQNSSNLSIAFFLVYPKQKKTCAYIFSFLFCFSFNLHFLVCSVLNIIIELFTAKLCHKIVIVAVVVVVVVAALHDIYAVTLKIFETHTAIIYRYSPPMCAVSHFFQVLYIYLLFYTMSYIMYISSFFSHICHFTAFQSTQWKQMCMCAVLTGAHAGPFSVFRFSVFQ